MSTATAEKDRQAAPACERDTATPTPVAALEYVDNAGGAAWLGVSPENLRRSRSTGTLCGCPAPAFLKLGVKSRVRYHVPELRRWMKAYSTEHVPRPPADSEGDAS